MSDEPRFAKGDLNGVMAAYPHVADWVRDFEQRYGTRPMYYGPLDRGAMKTRPLNLIYVTREPIFVHIYEPPADDDGGGTILWFGLEPQLTEEEENIRRELIETLLQEAPSAPSFTTDSEFENILGQMIDRYTILDTEANNLVRRQGRLWEMLGMDDKRLTVNEKQRERLTYVVIRDLIRNGPLEPLLSDEMLEDIHSVGLKHIHMDHKVFGMVTSNIRFRERELLSRYLRAMSERIGRPVSDNKPIIDGVLLDGSRINIIFSDDVSMLGPSFTIRKFAEETISITQLIQWGTMSSQVAAYIWICLEYGMSVLVSGETASGKTTTLNAILPFIDHNVKIYSAEDTPEVKVRHKIWQRLVTRDAKNEESRVEMFDLLKAALRSRPRYIIIGEIRGVEGATAFQAMQTGHPVIATFHASSIVKMIQRFTGDPINVPIRFFDNLNFAIFQEVVEAPGGGIARRITGIDEVIGYNKHSDGVLTRGMFEWDPVKDKHYFRGMFQSHLLENKIAAMAGFANKRDIYDEMLRRADAIQRMVDRGLTHYDDVFDLLGLYYSNGWDHFSRAVDTWVGVNQK
ncbi:type II/IV secretion system ATPase subunit [Candidatus Poseidonia alphae]|nr:type II/IV secretion system ATPase subunit [Candidatus Poseidonia alphae]MDA8530045.1 type II/IV secretion system ATPase subunit [Candidatus Poseidonia alphae]MDA8638800.1 type II/IV secretion system ATPase subunit [Candidatus Poseidonia alphae]MDA8758733.1 type II/IV secretion system ATPase subunit [Candidatus Poseidonia alphae]MDB2335958.1 type II/IV secretion system ATPase subunit [Candidatus Poseidonia alphae]